MNQLISKERLEYLSSLPGEVKGMGMKTHADFILKEEGPEGLKKLEESMEEVGYPVKYEELKRMAFYPLAMEALTIEFMQKLFDYDEEKFQEIGRFHSKTSWIVKLFMKYFFSFDKMAKEAPKIWRKYFTTGKLTLVDYSEEKKYTILRVEDFRFHPLHCEIVKGTLSTVIQMMVKGKVKCEEKKCVYRGDDYHEFYISWS